MNIKVKNKSDIIIDTPLDDPTQYSPRWRHQIAELLALDPKFKLPALYKEYHKDEYIRKQAEFLRAVKDDKVTKDQDAYRYALRWAKQEKYSGSKFKIEPLLLTPVSTDVIAKAMSGKALTKDPFEMYERLYFNIRDENWELNQSCHLRMYFALPEQAKVTQETQIPELWKVVGVQGGYMGLCRLWVWHSAPGVEDFDSRYLAQEAWRTAQATMLERIVKGQMKDFDLINWAGKFTESERLRNETNGTDTGANKMATMLLDVLSQAAPKVLEVSRTVDETAALNAKLEERRKAVVLKPTELSDNLDVGKLSPQEFIKGRIN